MHMHLEGGLVYMTPYHLESAKFKSFDDKTAWCFVSYLLKHSTTQQDLLSLIFSS